MFRFAACALLVCSAVRAAPPEPVVLKAHESWVSAVAFSPDGSRLAVASADKTVSVLDTTTWKETLRLKGHTDSVSAVAWSPDGKQLLTGSFDHTAKLWDAQTGGTKWTTKRHNGAVTAVSYTPKANAILTGSLDGNVRNYNLKSGSLQGHWEYHTSWVNALVAREQSYFVTASSDNRVFVPDPKYIEQYLAPKTAEVRSLSLAADDKALAAGTRYGVTKVWVIGAKEIKEVASLKGKHTGDVWGVSFGAGGKLLAVADGDWNKPSDVVLWDTATWKEKARLKHTNEVLCVAFHPTKPLVAAGAWDKTVRVWDVSEWAK